MTRQLPSSRDVFPVQLYLSPGSNDTLNLKWIQVEKNVPVEWYLFYCDNTMCHLNFPQENELKPILPGDDPKNNPMTLYVEHHHHPGEGVVKLLIKDIDDPEYTDTLTYHLLIANTETKGK